jgi:hypothetical protein
MAYEYSGDEFIEGTGKEDRVISTHRAKTLPYGFNPCVQSVLTTYSYITCLIGMKNKAYLLTFTTHQNEVGVPFIDDCLEENN